VSERYRLVCYVRVSDTKGREDTLSSPELQRDRSRATRRRSPPTRYVAGGARHQRHDPRAPAVHRGGRDGRARRGRRADRGEDQPLRPEHRRRWRDRAPHREGWRDFVSAQERYDPTPTGRFVRTLFFAMAELEADTIRENWSQAQPQRDLEGKHVSPWIPAGFVKPGKGEPMVPHPDYAPLIVEAFERRRTGADFSAIAAFLTEHGVRSRRAAPTGPAPRFDGCSRVASTSASIHHGEHRTVHNDLALVDRHTWDAVQAMHTSRPPRSRRRAYLLSGVSRCAGCGYSLKPYSASAAMVAKGSAPDYHYYRCSKHHAGGTCPAPASAPGRALDEYVTEWFLRADRGAFVRERGRRRGAPRGRTRCRQRRGRP
jgi:hypothetical protein